MLNKYLIWFLIMFLLSLFLFYMSFWFGLNDYCILIEYELGCVNSVPIIYIMYFDSKSMFFITVVNFISSLVILYSLQYMGFNSFSSLRFLFILLMFVLSMMMMIISPNLLSIMLGWDGLGMVSYSLVIYYNSVKSYSAGMLTCMINRLGDAGLLVSISWMFSFGSWYFLYMSHYFHMSMVLLIILSCFTSSAQIPFSSWLPAAMAAPTPVSSLVHSSTLVTAGVYLLIRFFDCMLIKMNLFIFMGVMTMMMSSFCANFEFDLKKIIAFSTLSQLGLMMVSLFLGLLDYTYFHMLSHAMFKSLLFLCSGIFIYYLCDNQDIRFMGSCSIFLPLTTSCFNISNLALCGIPFLSGFYSKDLILEVSCYNGLNIFLLILMYSSLGLTCCYTFRLLYYTLYKKYQITPIFFNLKLDYMNVSIILLTLFSVFFGCMFQWLMNFDLYFLLLPLYMKLMSVMMVCVGLWLGNEFNSMNYFNNLNFYFFGGMMWFMFSHMNYVYYYFYNYSNMSYKLLFWGEYYGPNLLFFMKIMSDYCHEYLNNNIKIYMITFLILFMLLI